MSDYEQGVGDEGAGVRWWLIALVVLLAIPVLFYMAIPPLGGGGVKGWHENSAIGALKTIGSAQSLFRETDKETDGNLDYGTLGELTAGQTGLIDAVLGAGTKDGYVFEVTYGAMTSEFIWFATASPLEPQKSGDRYFVTNHEGGIFYTTTGAFRMNSLDCKIPVGAKIVGK